MNESLFTNLCTTQCIFDSKRKIIVRTPKQTPIKGLTKTLPKIFFKGYKRQTQPNRGKNPRRYGIMYDYKINSILEHVHKTNEYNKLPIDYFVKNKDDIFNSLLTFPKTKYTLPTVNYMIKNRIIPVYAQYPIAHFTYNIGTCIDLICMSIDTNKLVIIENKTGYCVNYNKSIGNMQEPFTFLPNSQVNQHLVYLSFCVYMLKNCGLLVDPIKSAVLRLNENTMTLDEYRMIPSLYNDQVMYDALKTVAIKSK
jgi:hypothetical protein